MKSKRYLVAEALVALAKTAAPDADVLGLDDDARAPKRVGPGGQIVVRAGDPGDPEVDLSPLTYNYDHRFGVEIIAVSEAMIDALMVAIGQAIEADRFLGGLCQWLEAAAPETEEIAADNAKAQRGAMFDIVATYSTTSPLT